MEKHSMGYCEHTLGQGSHVTLHLLGGEPGMNESMVVETLGN